MISERGKKAGLKELSIFDNFQIDYNLPKYEKKDDIGKVKYDSNTPNEAWVGVPSNEGGTTPDGGIWIDGVQIKPRLRERLFNYFLKKLNKSYAMQNEEEKKGRKLLTIVEFFTMLIQSYEELTPIADIAEHYRKALTQAKTMGQSALVQQLEDHIDMIRGEAQLIAMNLKKYVTEKQVITFYEKVGEDKNLKLTWIKNFGRIIPQDVYNAKAKIDKRKIFDNYVVLQYDPANNGEKLTKEEVEKKKDPILFGVINNSRKLYYIADWKDDYCDLTLEEMFKTLKGRVLTINNGNVKTYISKIKV